jgi:hypothetical protein
VEAPAQPGSLWLLFVRPEAEKGINVEWIMMVYQLPKSRTSAKKLAIWRKLNRLGVYSPQDSVFILPYSERTLEHFEWLGEEIVEMGGEVALWAVRSLKPFQDERIKEYFLEKVNEQYRSVMARVDEIDDLEELRGQWALFGRIKTQDYLKSPLSSEVQRAIENKAAALSGKKEENE